MHPSRDLPDPLHFIDDTIGGRKFRRRSNVLGRARGDYPLLAQAELQRQNL